METYHSRDTTHWVPVVWGNVCEASVVHVSCSLPENSSKCSVTYLRTGLEARTYISTPWKGIMLRGLDP